MKKQKNYALLAMAIPVAIALLFHIGIGCEIKKEKKEAPKVDLSDYAIMIESNDTLSIWDGNRFVGKIGFTDDSEIGQLLMNDNQ